MIFIKFIIYTIAFTLIYKIIKFVIKVYLLDKSRKDTVQDNSKHNSNIKIKDDDIIDADFTEIKTNKNGNNN